LEIYTYLDTNFNEAVDKSLSADNTRIVVGATIPDQNTGGSGSLTIAPTSTVCDTSTDYVFTYSFGSDTYTTAKFEINLPKEFWHGNPNEDLSNITCTCKVFFIILP